MVRSVPKWRALVVDDDAALAQNMGELLAGGVGVQADLAFTASEARTLAQAADFRLLLIDERLPDGSGTELLRELRATLPLAEGIVVTAQATVETAASAVASRAYAYVVKPFSSAALVETAAAALADVIQRHERERERLALDHDGRVLGAALLGSALGRRVGAPLGSVVARASGLRDAITQAAVDEAVSRELTAMHDEILRVERIVDEFQVVARARPLELRPTDVGRLCQQVLQAIGPTARALGVRVHHAEPAAHSPVPMDDRRVRHALSALVRESLHGMPDGGELWMRSRVASTGVEIDVEDTGSSRVDDVDLDRPLPAERLIARPGLFLARELLGEAGGALERRSSVGRNRVTVVLRGVTA